jgi:hypothetical protein
MTQMRDMKMMEMMRWDEMGSCGGVVKEQARCCCRCLAMTTNKPIAAFDFLCPSSSVPRAGLVLVMAHGLFPNTDTEPG